MKKIVTILILVVMIFNITITSMANSQLITKEELENYFKKFLEEDETEADILVSDNKIELTEKETNTKAEMQFDLEKNEFYTEATFTRDMKKEDFNNNMSELIVMPMIGFFAISDKLGVEEDVYEQYAMENGVAEKIIATTMIIKEAEQAENFDAIALLEKYITEQGIEKEEYKYYLTESEIIKVDENTIQIKSKIIVNVEQDFSKMKDDLQNLVEEEITKENADIYISLKVGETCAIESTIEEDKKFYGFSFLSGRSIIDIKIDEAIIEAKEVGVAYGYLYFVDDEENFIIDEGEESEIQTTTKTVYIEIEEGNKENNNQVDDNQNNNKEDNTKADKELPNAGKTMIIGIIVMVILCFVVVTAIRYKKLT